MSNTACIDLEAASPNKRTRMRRASEKRRLARQAAAGITPAADRAIKILKRELRTERPMSRAEYRAQHSRARALYRASPSYHTDRVSFGSVVSRIHLTRGWPSEIGDQGAWVAQWVVPATSHVTQREMWRSAMGYEAALVSGRAREGGAISRRVDVAMAREARRDSGFRPAWGPAPGQA